MLLYTTRSKVIHYSFKMYSRLFFPVSLLFMLILTATNASNKQYDDMECSSGIVPGIDGQWMCDPSWFLDDGEDLADLTDGNNNSFVSKNLDDDSWTLNIQVSEYFAISKILISSGCPGISQNYVLVSVDIWDEFEYYDAETEEFEGRWKSVKDSVPLVLEKELLEEFSFRSPFWRLTFRGENEFCLREIAFYTKAGIAAWRGSPLYDDDAQRMFVNAEVMESEINEAPTTFTCHQVVTPVPSHIVSKYRLQTSFYTKYTSAYGIPVMSSRVVDDRALQRACYVVRFMLAGRNDIRSHMYSNKGRVTIIGRYERVPQVPEFRQFPTFNRRAAGGTYAIPVNVGAEENMLCEARDGYARNQDIFMHEFAHGIHLIAAYTAIPNFNSRLKQSLTLARRLGRWRNTYANTNHIEYFAEGVQAYFNQQREGPRGGDGIQNDISTRAKLKAYDRNLYNLVEEIFPCDNSYIPRCNDISQKRGLAKTFTLDCKGGKGTDGKETEDKSCKDDNENCQYWSKNGECEKSTAFMNDHCKKSCRKCEDDKGTDGKETGGACNDENENCGYWRRNGECDKNPGYMHKFCKKSCKKCAGSSCADNNNSCHYWLSFCSSNDYVMKNCKKTCNKC